MIENVINNLESTGLIDINTIRLDYDIIDRLQRDQIKEISPNIFREIIRFYETDKEKQQIENVIERISLFFKTKYSSSSIFKNWQSEGKIPASIRQNVQNSNIKDLAERIIRKTQQLLEAEERIRSISSKEKRTKKDEESMRLNSQKTEDISDEIDTLKDDFIFALYDIESSLGSEF